jgi:hypothetical protein
MSENPPHLHRVRITSPRAVPGGRSRRRSVSSEIDAQSELGEVYMRSLVRSQLRLAIGVVLVVAMTVGLLPVLFEVVPATRTAKALGVPLPWLLLGLVVYPVLVGVGWAYVHRAEHNERVFSDLVDRR